MTPWACNHPDPQPHPFDPRILDVACGFMLKLTDPQCHGCHRRRPDWPGEQLAALGEKLHPNHAPAGSGEQFRVCYTCSHWPKAQTGDHRRHERCMHGFGLTFGLATCREWAGKFEPHRTPTPNLT